MAEDHTTRTIESKVAVGVAREEERISVATQWQLIWWRFRKHKVANIAAIVLITYYVVVLFADFFAYADDAELGLRARIGGWRCLSVPTAVVHHRLGGTLGRHSERRLFLIERNRIWLAVKLFPARLLILNPLYAATRLVATTVAWVAGRGELARADSSISPMRLLRCLLQAHWAAIVGLPAMLRKRRDMRCWRKLSPSDTARMIRRFQIPLADLVGKAR